MKRLIWVATAAVLLLQVALADPQATIKTENGIPVVHNPKEPGPPPGTLRSLTLKPDLTIGAESGDENYMFADLAYVLVDDAERIYTLDAKDFKIRVYDKDGKFVRAFGKKGQGPGEIGAPGRLEAAPGRRLVLSDAGNNKFIFFSRDGTVEREVPIGTQRFSRFKLDSQGNTYAAVFATDRANLTLSYELKKLDQDFRPLGTLASAASRISPTSRSEFNPSLAFQVTSRDALVWGIADSDRYELTLLDPNGKPLRRMIKAYEPVRISAEQKAATIKRMFGDGGIPPGLTYEIPDRYPGFMNFVIDDQDRLFVRTYAGNERNGEKWVSYDVFDGDLRYIARFSVPEREMVFASSRNKLYCSIRENEAGFPQVKRYALNWK